MNEAHTLNYGGLDCLAFRHQLNPELVIILLHGYGANQHDLFPLASMLATNQSQAFYFPNAPEALSFPGVYEGRAWFHLNPEVFTPSLHTDYIAAMTHSRHPGLNQARDALLSFISALGVSPKNVILGGFSQGSMVCVHSFLTSGFHPKALLLWSGALVERDLWSSALMGRPKIPILLSHGHADPVLPFAAGKSLGDLFKSAGFDVRLIAFDGGHEIPPEVLGESKQFVQNCSKL